jgi:K+-sensing histidine kinase KdpD
VIGHLCIIKLYRITQVVFGQTSRSRWNILIHGSILNRFLREVRDATVQVVPLETRRQMPLEEEPATDDMQK